MKGSGRKSGRSSPRVPVKKARPRGPRDRISIAELAKRSQQLQEIEDPTKSKKTHFPIRSKPKLQPICGAYGATVFAITNDEITCKRCLRVIDNLQRNFAKRMAK